MKRAWRRIGSLLSRLPRAAWTAISLTLVLVLWQIGHNAYGSLLLPSPSETFAALWQITIEGQLAPAVIATARNALGGFAAAVLIGTSLGALAGASPILRHLLQPIATLMLGVPAIAWVVLSLLWFGGTASAVAFTVMISSAPILFSGAAEGVRTVDGALKRMALAFRVPRHVVVLDVYLPHLLSYLFPPLATALALSWKVAVMTELLSGAGGIGDGLATARAQVDTIKAMAWIAAVVIVLLALEQLVLEPIRHRFENWRRQLDRDSDPDWRVLT
ncbi:MAG: ABC transporter permease subunit [Alphaproteobacteria bacterium]|nr:ABC transporter permease subunit [Alphaproteobacteria bacterium]